MVMEGGVQVQQECTQVGDEFRQTGDKGRSFLNLFTLRSLFKPNLGKLQLKGRLTGIQLF